MPNNLPNAAFNGVEVQQGLYLNNYVDDSATAGNRTVDALRGRSAIANGATAATITNAYCRATSTVVVMPIDLNILVPSFKVVPGAGSFVVTVPADPGADWKFSWVVLT